MVPVYGANRPTARLKSQRPRLDFLARFHFSTDDAFWSGHVASHAHATRAPGNRQRAFVDSPHRSWSHGPTAMNRPAENRSCVITCSGARAAERRLLEEIDRLAASAAEDLSLPVRIVVPSRSLRHHLIRVIARRRGGVAGLQIQTLLRPRDGGVGRRGDPGPRWRCRIRGAGATSRRRPAFVANHPGRAHRRLRCGDRRGARSARCRVSTGQRGGCDRAPGRGRGRGRARNASNGLARWSDSRRRSSSTPMRWSLWRSTQALQIAEDRIHLQGPEALPTRALLVHGFADVTGIAADLLLALVRVHGGVVILDRPPDPAEPAREDLGGAFLSRIDERLGAPRSRGGYEP